MLQNYCLVNTQNVPNICDNVIVWNGDTSIWNPPSSHLALPQETTPTKIWVFNEGSYSLQDSVGGGSIGWTWDGTYLITSEPQPVNPPPQPPNDTVETF